jgi:transcriptional regulator with AAA-type ATPase domain
MTYGNFLLSKRDFRGALKEYLQAEKVAPSALGRGRAAINQGISLTRLWDFAAAGGPLDRAIRILKKARCAAELAIARSARAAIHNDQGHYGRALSMFLHAARAFQRLGKVDREAEVLGLAGYSAGLIAKWSKSGELLDRTISLASITGQHLVLSCAYANRALVCAQNEDLEKASTFLGQCRRILRGQRDWVGTLHMCRAQAKIAAQVGKWKEVFQVARRAERLATKVGDALRVVEFRKMRAQAEEHLGHKKASSIARSSAGHLEALLQAPKDFGPETLVAKLAASEMPVLIVGESGTEKAVFARDLHQRSPRAKGPCVVVPCEHLSFPASDLYGHAEGAWSGAARSSKGYVSSAQGGTLILDSLDQMPSEDQHILIPLFDRKTRSVGGIDERVLDVRVVATCATIDTIIPEVRTRLEGAILRTRSLRDQKAEIPRRVHALLADRRVITPDAVVELSRHRWEGNMDEIKSVVEQLIVLSDRRIGRKLVRQVLAGRTRFSPKERVRIQAPRQIEPVIAQ